MNSAVHQQTLLDDVGAKINSMNDEAALVALMVNILQSLLRRSSDSEYRVQ